jgi:hypothetical protein
VSDQENTPQEGEDKEETEVEGHLADYVGKPDDQSADYVGKPDVEGHLHDTVDTVDEPDVEGHLLDQTVDYRD